MIRRKSKGFINENILKNLRDKKITFTSNDKDAIKNKIESARKQAKDFFESNKSNIELVQNFHNLITTFYDLAQTLLNNNNNTGVLFLVDIARRFFTFEQQCVIGANKVKKFKPRKLTPEEKAPLYSNYISGIQINDFVMDKENYTCKIADNLSCAGIALGKGIGNLLCETKVVTKDVKGLASNFLKTRENVLPAQISGYTEIIFKFIFDIAFALESQQVTSEINAKITDNTTKCCKALEKIEGKLSTDIGEPEILFTTPLYGGIFKSLKKAKDEGKIESGFFASIGNLFKNIFS